MKNIKLLFPNLVYSGTFSGASGWQTGDLSINALYDRVLKHVARSVNATEAKTKFVLALNRNRYVGGLVILGHNFSLSAIVRATYSLVPDFSTIVAQTETNAFPRLYHTADLPFESPNWFLGTPLPEDTMRTTTAAICLLDTDVVARYIRVEIIDPANPAGYVEIGKLFVGPSFNPARNYAQGASLTVTDASRSSESLGGTKFFNKRGKRRVMSFSFTALDEKENFAKHFDLSAEAGITEELMLIPEPDDLVNLQRKSFCGYFREPTPFEQFSFDRMNLSAVVEELI